MFISVSVADVFGLVLCCSFGLCHPAFIVVLSSTLLCFSVVGGYFLWVFLFLLLFLFFFFFLELVEFSTLSLLKLFLVSDKNVKLSTFP